MKRVSLLIAALACVLASSFASADEGMLLYNAFPNNKVRTQYGFEATQDWLDHLRLSSVRFNNGGSGSFVSADGLIMTNHHVGVDCLQKISTKDKDYITAGFSTLSYAEEPKCVDLELNVLMGIEDVQWKV